MKNKVFIYDAFTENLFCGNQAAIIFDAENLKRDEMQKIAKEFNFSESVFVLNGEKTKYKLKYFTPCEEVDLCGHATIACIKSLLDEKKLNIVEGENIFEIETNVGILKIFVEIKNFEVKNIMMEQDNGNIENIDNIYEEKIMKALNLSIDTRRKDIQLVKAYTGLWDLMIALEKKEFLDNIMPNFEEIKKISKELNIISFHPFYFDEENKTCYVRNFAPIVDINEEAATGTSNAALLYFLNKLEKIKENEVLNCIQGENMGRASKIQSKIKNSKILVGGNAKRFLSGNLV